MPEVLLESTQEQLDQYLSALTDLDSAVKQTANLIGPQRSASFIYDPNIESKLAHQSPLNELHVRPKEYIFSPVQGMLERRFIFKTEAQFSDRIPFVGHRMHAVIGSIGIKLAFYNDLNLETFELSSPLDQLRVSLVKR